MLSRLSIVILLHIWQYCSHNRQKLLLQCNQTYIKMFHSSNIINHIKSIRNLYLIIKFCQDTCYNQKLLHNFKNCFHKVMQLDINSSIVLKTKMMFYCIQYKKLNQYNQSNQQGINHIHLLLYLEHNIMSNLGKFHFMFSHQKAILMAKQKHCIMCNLAKYNLQLYQYLNRKDLLKQLKRILKLKT